MSVAAIMLVRDEADIIGYTVEHLLREVDAVYVADNGSQDGTREILQTFTADERFSLSDDPEIGYWQARKTTALARRAGKDGHEWVVPCDADEFWTAPDGGRVADYLGRMGLDVQAVRAYMLNHVPTGVDDPDEPDPRKRIGWRQEAWGALPKVACRTHPALSIHAGNHGCDYGRAPVMHVGGLEIRHYTWRSEDQYVTKIRNGVEAYAATSLPEGTGAHWRMWEGHDDDTIREHFRQWFYEEDPPGQHGLVFDPAAGWPPTKEDA